MTELMLLAYDYLDNLRSCEKYQKYIEVNKQVKEKHSADFSKLAETKKKFEEVLEYGNHHPDFREMAKKYSNMSKEVYSIPLIKQQMDQNKEFEARINKFVSELTGCISNHIPILNELGIVASKGGIMCGC